jgi:hypothetical protein
MADRANTEINLIFNDIYTEVSDPINTVKKYTNDRYFFSMTEGRTPMLDIFVQSGRFKDSFLTLFGRDEPIFRIGNIREHEVNMDLEEPSWFKAYVRMDNKEVTVVRTEYTYTNMFAEIGGLQRTIKSILYFLIGGMTWRRYVNAILGSLYYMKKNRDEKLGVLTTKKDDLDQY